MNEDQFLDYVILDDYRRFTIFGEILEFNFFAFNFEYSADKMLRLLKNIHLEDKELKLVLLDMEIREDVADIMIRVIRNTEDVPVVKAMFDGLINAGDLMIGEDVYTFIDEVECSSDYGVNIRWIQYEKRSYTYDLKKNEALWKL